MSKFVLQLIRNLCKLYPFLSGCGTLAQTRILSKLVQSNCIDWQFVKIRNGLLLYVNPNDYVGRSIYLFGDLDRKISALFKRLLRNGDCVLDVGANCGLYTLISSDIVGNEGRIEAFEPQKQHTDAIAKSISANKISNVTVHGVALSKESKNLQVISPLANSGALSLSEESSVKGEKVTIPVKKAMDYLNDLHLPKVRLMKVDIEGHEGILFEELAPWLIEDGPEFIIFEEHRSHDKESTSFKVLKDCGYRIKGILRTMFVLKIVDEEKHGFADLAIHDFLAIKTGSEKG